MDGRPSELSWRSRPRRCSGQSCRESLGNRVGPAPPLTSPLEDTFPRPVFPPLPHSQARPRGAGAGRSGHRNVLGFGRDGTSPEAGGPNKSSRWAPVSKASCPEERWGFYQRRPSLRPLRKQPSSVLTELSSGRSGPGRWQLGPSVLPRCHSASGRSRPAALRFHRALPLCCQCPGPSFSFGS